MARRASAPKPYRHCSLITSAHRCTTSTLILQYENEYRSPTEQSEQFYASLKAQGVPAEMLRFPGSSHGGSVLGPITCCSSVKGIELANLCPEPSGMPPNAALTASAAPCTWRTRSSTPTDYYSSRPATRTSAASGTQSGA